MDEFYWDAGFDAFSSNLPRDLPFDNDPAQQLSARYISIWQSGWDFAQSISEQYGEL